MKTLPFLCQALLNGPLQPSDLVEAERSLSDALEATDADRSLPGIGENWRCDLLTSDQEHTATPASRMRAVAPLYLLDAVWLSRVAQPAMGHEVASALLLRIYLETVGLKNSTQSPPLRFRARLIREGIDLPPLESPDFFARNNFPEAILRFSLWHLALMHRPQRFFPEVLGYTLAHVCREPESVDNTGNGAMRHRQDEWAREAVNIGIRQGFSSERLSQGWGLYVSALRAVKAGLLAREAEASGTREDRLVEIVRDKLPHALGYHGRIRLRGKSLDTWMREHADDPAPLLLALRDSSWVQPQCPAASRLIQAMDFGGPMYGVFSVEEREAALDWIQNPGTPRPTAVHASIASLDEGVTAAESKSSWTDAGRASTGKSSLRGTRMAQRDLYLALLRAESPADVPDAAESFVMSVLRRARWMNFARWGAPPFAYCAESLREFTETRHRKEVDRYRPLQSPPRVDHAFCLWVIRQLAPAILTDGAWLADVPGPPEKLDGTLRYLLKIYVDELGEGHPERNHPNVYRRLLEEQGIALPDFASDDFARHPALLDAAFDIPVYLLSMGLLGERHRAEQLGLNLAIELSGLGAGYLRAIDILRHHGMDPTIIRLHLSIDNLASGHAAWAREAIVLHLDEIRRREGSDAVEAAWRRVRLGYRSLQAASLRLTASIVGRYALHRLGWRADPARSTQRQAVGSFPIA